MEKIVVINENSNKHCSEKGQLDAQIWQQYHRYLHVDSEDCCVREHRRLVRSEDNVNSATGYSEVGERNKKLVSKSQSFIEQMEYCSSCQHQKDSFERGKTVNPKFGTSELSQKKCQQTVTMRRSADIYDNNHWFAKGDNIFENGNMSIFTTKEPLNYSVPDEDFAVSPRKHIKDHKKQDRGTRFSKNGRRFVKSVEDARNVFDGFDERISKNGFNQRYGNSPKKFSTYEDGDRVIEDQTGMPNCGTNYMGDPKLVMFENSTDRDQHHVCTTRAHKKVREWLQTSCSIDSGNDSIETADTSLVTALDDTKRHTKPSKERDFDFEPKHSMKETTSNAQAKMEDLGRGSPLYKRLLKKKIRLQNEGLSASHSTFEHLRELTIPNTSKSENESDPSTQEHASKLSAREDSLGLFPTATISKSSETENYGSDGKRSDKSRLLWRKGWNIDLAKVGTNSQKPRGDLIGLVCPQKGQLKKQLFQFDEAATLPPINCISKTQGKKVLTVLRKTKAGLEIENRFIHLLGRITEGYENTPHTVELVSEINSPEVDKRTVSWVENQRSLNRRIKV